MTLKSETLLLQILDDYSSGASNSLEAIAIRNGIAIRTLFMWMRDENLIVDYLGREGITFGQAMGAARNVMKIVTVGRVFEDYVLNGRKVEAWHHGEPSYVDDEQAILIDDLDTREMLYGYRDGKKRDADGHRIIRTRVEYAPAQLIQKFAESNMPKIYGNKSEVTMKGSVGLGVTTVGVQRPIPPDVLAKLEPVTETMSLAPPTTNTDEVFEAEEEIDEVEQPEPEPVERIIRSAPTARETVAAATPAPVGVNEVPLRAPRNALEADLFDKLAAARGRATL